MCFHFNSPTSFEVLCLSLTLSCHKAKASRMSLSPLRLKELPRCVLTSGHLPRNWFSVTMSLVMMQNTLAPCNTFMAGLGLGVSQNTSHHRVNETIPKAVTTRCSTSPTNGQPQLTRGERGSSYTCLHQCSPSFIHKPAEGRHSLQHPSHGHPGSQSPSLWSRLKTRCRCQ